jgi:site-specific DNA recombinase
MVEIQGLVRENARKSQNQQKYREKFNALVQRIETQKATVSELKDKELQLIGAREKYRRFIKALEQCGESASFNEQLWSDIIERVVVDSSSLTYEFKNGTAIRTDI